MRVKKATLKRKGKKKKKITLHIDGEPLTLRNKVKISVIPKAVKVMVPVLTNKKSSIKSVL